MDAFHYFPSAWPLTRSPHLAKSMDALQFLRMWPQMQGDFESPASNQTPNAQREALKAQPSSRWQPRL